jgi:ferrochelatase
MAFADEPPPVSERPPAGVLLVNIGSPTAATASAARAFLRQFLSDPRVVELPRVRWWLIRNLFILPLRPFRTARAYRKIWTDEGSPLISMSRYQAADLEWELTKRTGHKIPVFAAMRYGKPAIAAGLDVLRRRGCQRLLVFPLFPQYSATTTASAFDRVSRELSGWRRVPELRTIAGYHDHPAYIGALVSQLYNRWKDDGAPARLVVSYHGLPQRYIDAGDPYEDQCRATTSLLSARLEFESERIVTAFQSRFGREPWTEPNLKDTLRELGKARTGGVHVICPGFAADCLETLEEVAMAGEKVFTKAGGSGFHYVRALNRTPEHISALAEIAIEHLSGWVTP